jgi:hypothetical protein
MGSARLDIRRLAGLLERIKIACEVLDGDEAADHCVLRAVSIRRPDVAALIEYENQGVEPRLAGMTILSAESTPEKSFKWQKTLRLEGPRKDDPEKIARWVKEEFLGLIVK